VSRGKPHLAGKSWAIKDWPSDIFPGSPTRGRTLVRCHRNDLVAAGALARVGRTLVVLGPQFERWLQRGVPKALAEAFPVPANERRRST
jgi:hypothetical protein